MRKTTTAATLAAMVLIAGYAPAATVCGDVNDNGTVTSADALLVLQEAVQLPVALICELGVPRTGQTTGYGPGTDGVVRAGVARSFTDNGDGTITDNVTGLMWEKKDDSGGIHDKDNTYTWSSGTGNMDGTIQGGFLVPLNDGAGFAGYKDWRVPNIMELQTLVNFGAVSPAAYPAFHAACVPGCKVTKCSCTPSDYYWSASTYPDGSTRAWYVDAGYGYVEGNDKTSGNFVRAVRGGL